MVASCGNTSKGFFSDRSYVVLVSFSVKKSGNKVRKNPLLTNRTGTLPAFAATMISSVRGRPRSSSADQRCLVAARVKNALTSGY